ncbi:MAG: hypothetical protein ABWW70_06020 [Thermoproteota archaeon]
MRASGVAVRVALEAVPRAAAAYALWGSLELEWRFLEPIVGARAPASALAQLLADQPVLPIALASSALAAAAIALASPLAYAASLALAAAAWRSVEQVLSPAAVLALALLLAADALRQIYRPGQGASLRLGRREVWKAAAGLAAVAGIAAAGALVGGRFAALLLHGIGEAAASAASASPVLAALMSNRVVTLTLAVVLAVWLYRAASLVADTVTVYAFPSRRLALGILRGRGDVDVFVEAPLEVLKSMVVALAVAPLVYAAVYRAVLPAVYAILPTAEVLSSLPARVAVGLIVFTISYAAVRRFIRGFSVHGPARVVGLSVGLTLFVYASAVAVSLRSGASLVDALVRPDVESLGRGVVSSYVAFYTLFFYLVELVARLVGVAP